jgi:hypothetical protein
MSRIGILYYMCILIIVIKDFGYVTVVFNTQCKHYTGCLKKRFTTLKTYINLFREHVQYLNCHNVANTHRILPGTVTVQYDFQWYCRVFRKVLSNGIPNVTVRRVLRKLLHLKAYKLSNAQYL